MINATSLGGYQVPVATNPSQVSILATASQSVSPSNSITSGATLVTGSGLRHGVTWSHVLFWAAGIMFSMNSVGF
jgi:hypothetical protein